MNCRKSRRFIGDLTLDGGFTTGADYLMFAHPRGYPCPMSFRYLASVLVLTVALGT